MNGIYISIVILVLYGDLLKRILPAQASLIALYIIAVFILAIITIVGNSEKPRFSKEARSMLFIVIMLIFLYLIQMLLSVNVPFFSALSNAAYICIPLLYTVIILRFYQKFDLARLARNFLVLMIPINAAGIIQYYIDPSFMIISVYSGELGGVIYRNLFEVGNYFSRYPSIFTSADRYSAMGLMQLFFTFVLLSENTNHSKRNLLWIAINFISGATALLIAGARSRIIIAFIVIIIFLIVFLLAGKTKNNVLWNQVKNWTAPAAIFVSISVMLFIFQFDSNENNTDLYPVVTLFSKSLEQGELANRVSNAGNLSLMPEELTMFGQGIGSVGEGGKPGEFGIRSIWIESGLVFGMLVIAGFALIIWILFYCAYKQFLKLDPVGVVLFSFPSVLVLFALLAGLTSAFELSSGILLCCIIGANLADYGQKKQHHIQ